MDRLDRLKYLVYRCVACTGMLTKLEIIERWEKQEREGTHATGICECGGRQIRKSNPTTLEYERYSKGWNGVKQWFRYVILRKNDEGTRLWRLYYVCVKGKSLVGTPYDPDVLEEPPEPPLPEERT